MAKPDIRTYKVGKTTVKINRSACISCGTCTSIAPEIFDLDDDLICTVKENPSQDEKLIYEASENCTSEAIKITRQ